MFNDPPHVLNKDNNPFTEHFSTINTHFTRKTTAAAGRLSRQRYTNTVTRIKKRRANKRSSNNSNDNNSVHTN